MRFNRTDVLKFGKFIADNSHDVRLLKAIKLATACDTSNNKLDTYVVTQRYIRKAPPGRIALDLGVSYSRVWQRCNKGTRRIMVQYYKPIA